MRLVRLTVANRNTKRKLQHDLDNVVFQHTAGEPSFPSFMLSLRQNFIYRLNVQWVLHASIAGRFTMLMNAPSTFAKPGVNWPPLDRLV